jgi:hypothetical protein
MKHRYWIPALLVIGGIALGFVLGRATMEPGEGRAGKADGADGPSGKSGQDPDAASEWLRKQPEDLRTDGLYGETAEHLRRNNDYGQSVEWAEQIEDQDTRNQKLGRIYRDWKGDDEEKAQEWFDGLDASVRDEVESGTTQPHTDGPAEFVPTEVDPVTESTE